jgi:hypothetical protein
VHPNFAKIPEGDRQPLLFDNDNQPAGKQTNFF